MSIEYLTKIWVVGKYGYSSLDEAKRNHPTRTPKVILYNDRAWPTPVTKDVWPNHYRAPEPKESLRTILERCWESWREKNEGTVR